MFGDLPEIFAIDNGMPIQDRVVYFNNRGTRGGLDDLEIAVYDATRVPAHVTYTVEIVEAATYDVNMTQLTNDTYQMTRQAPGYQDKTSRSPAF